MTVQKSQETLNAPRSCDLVNFVVPADPCVKMKKLINGDKVSEYLKCFLKNFLAHQM